MPSPRPLSASPQPGAGRDDVTIGIMTALPVEGAAVKTLVMHGESVEIPEDPNTYHVGYMASRDAARPHRVAVVTLPQDNTRNAAATCTDLLRTFHSVRCVLVVGVAGGIPAPHHPEKHIRRGDVVVADGIVDFGHIRQVDGREVVRRPVEGICVDFQRAIAELRQRDFEAGARSLDRELNIPRRLASLYGRPPAETDRLIIGGQVVPHPDPTLTGHRPDRPKIHYGPIGSGDVLLRDEQRRDELAAQHGILAVEMEGSGVAASARLRGVQWFMVRGISDYCENNGKDDLWHRYAAMMAAAYARTLLSACRPFPVWPTAPRSGVLALVPGPDRDDIVRMLDRIPGLDPQALWHAAAGDLALHPDELPDTIGAIFDHLLELNAVDGLPPAVAMLEEVARLADESNAALLRRCSDSLAVRLHAVEPLRRRRQQASDTAGQPSAQDRGPERAAKPCLVIQIVPDGIDRRRCVADYWIQRRTGPWHPEPGGESTEVLFSALEPVLEAYIRHAERTWRENPEPATVEFLLPTELLNLPVEWWRTDLDSAVPSPLCANYGVVLRNLDRMRAEHRHRVWLMRWTSLWQDPAVHRVLYGSATGGDLAQWGAHLQFHTDIASVVLSTPPDTAAGRDELDLAMRAGVPIVLWDRRPPTRAADPSVLQDLTDGAPEQLLHGLHRLRMAAATSGPRPAADHPGRHIAVLWDDPKRLVGFGSVEQ